MIPATQLEILTDPEAWTELPADAPSFLVDTQRLSREQQVVRNLTRAATEAAGLPSDARLSAIRTRNALVFYPNDAGRWTLDHGRLRLFSSSLFGDSEQATFAYAVGGTLVVPQPVLNIRVPHNETSSRWCRLVVVNVQAHDGRKATRVYELASARVRLALGLTPGLRFDVLLRDDHVWLHPNPNGACEVPLTGHLRFSEHQLSWFSGRGQPRLVAFETGWAVTGASGRFGSNGCTGQELTPTCNAVREVVQRSGVAIACAQPNLSEYNAYEGERLQVAGAWLTEFGFVPGARYHEVPNPLFRNRMVLVLDPHGEHQVTAMGPGSTAPKLYVSPEALAHVGRGRVRVFGAFDGLQVSGVGSKVVPFTTRPVRAEQPVA